MNTETIWKYLSFSLMLFIFPDSVSLMSTLMQGWTVIVPRRHMRNSSCQRPSIVCHAEHVILQTLWNYRKHTVHTHNIYTRSRQMGTQRSVESGSAPKFLPVKSQFFLATVSKCLLMGGKCGVSVNKLIKEYGLALLSLESIMISFFC